MHRSSFLLVVLCLHCGGQAQTGPGEEAPTTPAATEAPAADTETAAPNDTAAPDKAGAPEKEGAPDKATTPDSAAAPAATSSTPPCAKLPRADCKVRKGCAWSDKQKCVEEGGGM